MTADTATPASVVGALTGAGDNHLALAASDISGFIASILARHSLDRLSKKQISCIDNIIGEAYRRGVRVDRSAA